MSEAMNDIALVFIVVAVIAFIIYVPLFKTWFGLRKPKGHRGGWLQ